MHSVHDTGARPGSPRHQRIHVHRIVVSGEISECLLIHHRKTPGAYRLQGARLLSAIAFGALLILAAFVNDRVPYVECGSWSNWTHSQLTAAANESLKISLSLWKPSSCIYRRQSVTPRYVEARILLSNSWLPIRYGRSRRHLSDV